MGALVVILGHAGGESSIARERSWDLGSQNKNNGPCPARWTKIMKLLAFGIINYMSFTP